MGTIRASSRQRTGVHRISGPSWLAGSSSALHPFEVGQARAVGVLVVHACGHEVADVVFGPDRTSGERASVRGAWVGLERFPQCCGTIINRCSPQREQGPLADTQEWFGPCSRGGLTKMIAVLEHRGNRSRMDPRQTTRSRGTAPPRWRGGL